MESDVFYRMITRPYWPSEEEIDDIDSSVETTEIRTIWKDFRNKDNTLSIWNLEDPNDVALALINSGAHLEDTFIVKLKKSDLISSNLTLINNEGGSVFSQYNDKHYDITDVNYKQLGSVIKLILSSLKSEDYEIITTHEILKLIKKAIIDNKIEPKHLPKEIREKIAT